MGTPFVVDPGVNNTNPNYFNTGNGGSEPSVALDPTNPQQAVMTSFTGSWSPGNNAPLWHTLNGGQTWTLQNTIPPPPGIPAGCPCDQTVDFGRNGTLFGTFLVNSPTTANNDVVTGDTTNPANAASWQWNSPGGNTQLTNNAHAGNVDQPWMLVNRDTTTAANDDVFVAYDDFAATQTQVAVSLNSTPPNFARDNGPGTFNPQDRTNPGLRSAKDTSNGNMYTLWQTATDGPSGTAFNSPHNVTLHLNRTTDSGQNWTLNGNAGGLAINTGDQDGGANCGNPCTQPGDFKFGTVNALLGGVDHVAVNPSNHDVYLVYGTDGDGTGAQRNRIFIDRYSDNGAGTLTQVAGFPHQVGTSTDAALPSVAVTTDGVVGVLYDTFDGNNGSGFPTFSAHLARSNDAGVTFNDAVLSSFASPQTDNSNARQRVLGDYQQIKANGTQLYGTFSGNRQAFLAAASNVIDPVFFSVPGPSADLSTTKTASPNPVTAGSDLTYTITSTNNGTYDALNVRMSDTLPANTTFRSVTPPAGWTCTDPGVGNAGTVNCTTPSFATGTSAVFTLVVRVSPSAPNASVISNTASTNSIAVAAGTPPPPTPQPATPDPNGANNTSAAASVTVTTSANLETKKTGPAQTPPGTSASYTITVENKGPSDAQSVVLNDPLPAGTTFVSLTPAPGWTCTTPAVGTNGTVNCTKPTLAAGALDTFTLVLHFNVTVPSGTNVTNTATASSATFDPNGANNAGSATTLVVCDHTLTGKQSPSSIRLNGGSWCLSGAKIISNLTVTPGTTVIMVNSSVGSELTANSPSTIAICGSAVHSELKITGATGFVLVGDPGDDACDGNFLESSVKLANNTAGTELGSNRISADVTINNNSGTGPFLPDDDRTEIEANRIQGSLACSGNSPAPKNDGQPNTVFADRLGQCKAPNF